jgi:iron complex transport system substrate-binding protein
MRICSLLPSATESVAALGPVESLIAVSEERDWPPEVRGLPVVTASRADTTRLSSFEIDQAVREAVGDGRRAHARRDQRAHPLARRPARRAGTGRSSLLGWTRRSPL